MSNTCDYRFVSNGRAAARIKRKIDANIPIININVARRGNTNLTRYLYESQLTNTNSPIVGMLIQIDDYDNDGLHQNHAVSAVKVNKTLYCFNAWGKDALPIDANVFDKISSKYNCTKTVVYKGDVLQKQGVCVAYASNFVFELLKQVVQDSNNRMFDKVSQSNFNRIVSIRLQTQGSVFGPSSLNKTSINARNTQLMKSLVGSPQSPRSQLNLKNNSGSNSNSNNMMNINYGSNQRNVNSNSKNMMNINYGSKQRAVNLWYNKLTNAQKKQLYNANDITTFYNGFRFITNAPVSKQNFENILYRNQNR